MRERSAFCQIDTKNKNNEVFSCTVPLMYYFVYMVTSKAIFFYLYMCICKVNSSCYVVFVFLSFI